MMPAPSTIASTSMPWMSLLRTCTSFTSLSRIASMPSSVNATPAGTISLPSPSTTALTVSLPNILWTMVSRRVSRMPSSVSPSLMFCTRLVWFISLSLPRWTPRNEISATLCSTSNSKDSSVRIVSAGIITSPVDGTITSLSRTRPINLSFKRLTAWRVELAKRARSRTKSIPTTSQSSSRTMTSCDTSTRRRVK